MRPDTTAQSPHHLEHVVGQRGNVTLAVHLPQSMQPGLLPSQTIQGSKGSFRDGLTPATFASVRSRPVPFSGSQVEGMIHREAEEPSLLSRRKTGVLNGTGLTILRANHVLIGVGPLLERAPTQDLALGTDQVVAVIDEVAFGHHAVLLLGVDRDVGRDVPFLQEFTK